MLNPITPRPFGHYYYYNHNIEKENEIYELVGSYRFRIRGSIQSSRGRGPDFWDLSKSVSPKDKSVEGTHFNGKLAFSADGAASQSGLYGSIDFNGNWKSDHGRSVRGTTA